MSECVNNIMNTSHRFKGVAAMPGSCDFEIEASFTAISDLMPTFTGFLRRHGIAGAFLGEVELAVVEAMNNIVEHSYAGKAGQMRMSVEITEEMIDLRLSDSGVEMNKVPSGAPPANTDPMQTAESGYGWFLIHTLVDQLDYRRQGGLNLLTLRKFF
jgi:serine/threonine-protein kinase RsbW